MTRSAKVLRGLGYVGAVAVLVAAVAINKNLPSDRTTQAPFAVSGSMTDRLVGRDIAATVNGIAVVRRLRVEQYGKPPEMTTAGRWIVVDATVDAVLTPGSQPQGVALVIGNDRYSATNRMLNGLNSTQLSPGIPRRGLLAFEVPVSATAAKVAVLKLARTLDARLDSQLVFRLDLSDAPRLDQVEVRAARNVT